MLFGLSLTILSSIMPLAVPCRDISAAGLISAYNGYEIWTSVPSLICRDHCRRYRARLFDLLGILLLFSWVSLVAVRAEFSVPAI